MSDVVITAENLSKRYLVGHRSAERERYTALRDVLAREARNFTRKGLDFFRGRPIVQGDEVEEFWALRDVSFEVRRGQVLGIIGRNGAGKSTLLKILSRITEPDHGRAVLRGRVASLLEVGTGFHPELTGRENIFLNGAILGMTRAEVRRRFDEIAAFAEVERFLDTPVKRYSSGMYVRLAFSIAAHLEPEVLIVDEVLAVGDVDFQKKCLGKMQDVSKGGRTVLLVSHNMAAIQQFCARVLFIRNGRIGRVGAPNDVVKEYLAGDRGTSTISVKDWPDRSSSGEGKIVAFEILDENGQATDSVPLGGAVRFRITAEFYQPLRQPLFGICVHTASGEPMLDLRSFHDGLYIDRTSGHIVVEAQVRDLGLYPGEYTLSPWIVDYSSRSEVDWARHCAIIRITPSPGIHGDLRLDDKWGKYFLHSSWKVVDRVEVSRE
jgi:lipopolysaccharide transport system ATP-binding protein